MFRAVILALATVSTLSFGAPTTDSTKRWVGSWTTAPQLVESANMPPTPGLNNNSLRQIVRVSIGGDTVRLKFTNDFSTGTTTLKAVTIAASTGKGAITASTLKTLTFGGSPSVTMNASSSVMSDPVAFPLAPRMDVAITIYYGTTSSSVSGHPGSRTTSYLLTGDKSSSADFSGATSTEHWYNINTIDVLAPKSAASVAILANSIADGRGSTTDQQNRWPDIFSEALLKNATTNQVGVLNLGIGGNCVLSGGLGPTGVSRYQRDILDQRGIAWVIVSEGVNDIGGVNSASAATTTANNLITAYKKFIADAHARNLKVYGATIMPFNGNSYYNASSESCRSTVNKWIRTPGNYDAVIDFDKIMRSTSDTTKLGVATYQNDGLHPDAAAYKKMGQAIELGLFVPPSTGIVEQGHGQKSSAASNSAGSLKFDSKTPSVEYKGHRVDGRSNTAR
jgi:lysophospholipase L1-like esterase